MRYITNTAKDYGDMIIIKIYKEPFYSDTDSMRRHSRRKYNRISERSIRRTKQMIKDICLCNHFDLFCTFTFDKSKHNRYDKIHCQNVIQTWLRNSRLNHSPNLQYILIPELHKDGAIHFHALISQYNGSLRLSKSKNVVRPIYNLSGYRAGFSTAVKIDNQQAVANYITKYITKDLVLEFNKKRYWCSNNLKRPEKCHNVDVKSLRDLFDNRESYDNGSIIYEKLY